MDSQAKYENGFSLIGVLVAAGIIGFLALSFSDMLLNSKRGQMSVENSIDFDVLRSSIQVVLNNSPLCAIAFKNNDTPQGLVQFMVPTSGIPANKKLHSIFMGSSKIAEVGMILGGGLKIDKLELDYIPPPLAYLPPTAMKWLSSWRRTNPQEFQVAQN